MGRVLLEPEKPHKKAKKRKRRRVSTSSSSSDDWCDTEGELGGTGEDGGAAFWAYKLGEMCTKPEFQHSEIIKSMSAKEFTLQYFRESGLKEPLLFLDPPTQLGMKMPKASKFSVQSVKNLIGGDRVIEVIEVKSQGSRQMSLDEFVKYYKSEASKRPGLLNVLSLEFSMTPLGEKVLSPALVRQVDWVELYWPKELRCVDDSTDDLRPLFPKVQHYCLMSVKECFTDFHIDFGGTSVWYHVLKGKKIFWMIEPTEHNLVMYERWILEGNNTVFFGDIVEKCARVEISEGSTFIIPSGWIHAVYTPEDSLVFGGNFMHSFSIPMQLRVRLSEDRIKVAKKFRYPFFNEMLWYVIEGIVKKATGQTFLKPIQPSERRLRSRSSDKVPKDEEKMDKSNQQLASVGKSDADHLGGVMLAAMCSGLQPESEEERSLGEAGLRSEGNEAQDIGKISENQEQSGKECADITIKADETKLCDQSHCEINESESKTEHTNEEKQSDGEGFAAENGLTLKNDGSETEEKKEEIDLKKGPDTDLKKEPNADLKEEPDTDLKEEPNADLKEEPDTDSKEETDAAKENGGRFVEVKHDDLPDAELTFEDAYLATLTEFERNGYRELLMYVKKNMRFRSKMEPLNMITDPDKLLTVFEAVLDHEIDKEKLNASQGNDQTAEANSQLDETVVSPSQQKTRERKRKISTTPMKKEKVPKLIKSKNRKSDPGYHFEGPLIVGGLPPAIMPADAPQPPNPYGYDPLAAVTPLGHKQLPSAYRRTADMAKAPPSQKYRLQPIRQPIEMHTETKVQSEGGNAKLGPLRVDTCEAMASTSKSPLHSANITNEFPKDGAQIAAVANVRRRISEPSTSAALHRDEHCSTNSSKSRYAHDERPTTVMHHKSICPELEYKSPLARTYPVQVSASFDTFGISKMDESKSHRGNRRPAGIERSQRSYTDSSSRFRQNADGAPSPSSSNERRSNQGFSPRGWHMPAPPPPWASQQCGIRQRAPSATLAGLPPLRWPPPLRMPPVLPPQEMPVRGCDVRQPPASFGSGGFVPLVAPSPPSSKVQSSSTSPQTVTSTIHKGGAQWAQLARQEIGPAGTKRAQTATLAVPQSKGEQPSPGVSKLATTREEQVAAGLRRQISNADTQSHHERVDPIGEFQSNQEAQRAETAQGKHHSVEEVGDAERKINDSRIAGGYRPTPISDLPPRSDELLGIPVIQFERDPSVMGILKRRPTVVVQTNPVSSVPPSGTISLVTESSPTITLPSPTGTLLQPTSEPAHASDLPHELSVPSANSERIRRLSEAREQFPMGPPKLIEPKLAPASTKDSRAVPEPVDYMTAINELAKLVEEVNEDSGPKLAPPVVTAHLRRSDSSCVLSDPRCAKREAIIVEDNTENPINDEKKEISDGSETSSTPQKQSEETSQTALLDDLGFLTAEYNALGE